MPFCDVNLEAVNSVCAKIHVVISFQTGLFSLKMKYDESDNIMIRATRVVTDKLSDVFSK